MIAKCVESSKPTKFLNNELSQLNTIQHSNNIIFLVFYISLQLLDCINL